MLDLLHHTEKIDHLNTCCKVARQQCLIRTRVKQKKIAQKEKQFLSSCTKYSSICNWIKPGTPVYQIFVKESLELMLVPGPDCSLNGPAQVRDCNARRMQVSHQNCKFIFLTFLNSLNRIVFALRAWATNMIKEKWSTSST